MPPLVDFIIKPLEIKDQGSSDMCVSYAVSSSSEKQEGVTLEPAYLFAKTKQLMGDWQSWGADPVKALKASMKYGALEKSVSPYSLEKNGRNFVANWNNWDTKLDGMAQAHHKKSYFKLDAGSDMFSSIVIGLYDNRQINTTAVCGVYWQPEWTYAEGGIIKSYGSNKSLPHAIEAIGQKIIDGVPYLIVQNSWGEGVGDKGLYYFPQAVVNEFLFAYAMIDASPEDVRKVTWGFLDYLADWLKSLLKTLQDKPKQPDYPVVTPPSEVVPEPKISKLVHWARAIEEMENAPNEWNNPGAIRGKDGKFLKFSSYQKGFDYLCDYLTRAATGKHAAYPKGGETTLIEFQRIYSPSNDGNNPEKYANFVASRIKVAINDKIKDII